MSTPGKIEIYTDGGCVPNPGFGVYAFVIVSPDGTKREYVSEVNENTTNNRMEMSAVIAALWTLQDSTLPIIVYSDSEILVNGCTNQNWRARLRKGKNVPNTDLWLQLYDLYNGKEITFQWLKGHNGYQYNERCDELVNSQLVGFASSEEFYHI